VTEENVGEISFMKRRKKKAPKTLREDSLTPKDFEQKGWGGREKKRGVHLGTLYFNRKKK